MLALKKENTVMVCQNLSPSKLNKNRFQKISLFNYQGIKKKKLKKAANRFFRF